MFSNKPQLGLPKHYSFDIYSIRIHPTEAYQGHVLIFRKVFLVKHIKNGVIWSSFGCLRYTESFSEPQSIRRRLAGRRIKLGLGSWVATSWERAPHLDYRMFSLYFDLL